MIKNDLKELSKHISLLDLGQGYMLYLPYRKKKEKMEIYKLKEKTDKEALKEIKRMIKNNDFEIKDEPEYLFRCFFDNYDDLWNAEIPIGKVSKIVEHIDFAEASVLKFDEIVLA